MSRRQESSKLMKRRLGRPVRRVTTPVIKWKQQAVSDDELELGAAMATVMASPPAAPEISPSSARETAATLWELHEVPLPACFPSSIYSPDWIPHAKDACDVNASPFSQPDFALSPPRSTSASHRYLKTGAQRGLQRLLTRTAMEPSENSSRAPSPTPTLVGRRWHIPRPQFSPPGPSDTTTSDEILKVFAQTQMLEHQNASLLSLTATLQGQLQEAHARVTELEGPQRVTQRQVERLMKRFSDEKLDWKSRDNERVEKLEKLAKELESERMAGQAVERLCHELARENRGQKAKMDGLCLELDREKTKMDGLCQDLTREKAEVEEIKQQAQQERRKVEEIKQQAQQERREVEEIKQQAQQERWEVEDEREMLHVAERIREDRVQMKLGEAGLTLVSKSAALDEMRAQLESFLVSRGDRRDEDDDGVSSLRDARVLHRALSAVHYDTSVTTASSASSVASTFDEFTYSGNLDTDSSQGSPSRRRVPLYYDEGISDAD